MDERHLSRAPEECDDREAAVGLRVEHVAPVGLGGPGPSLGGEDAWRGWVPLQLGRYELGRLLPAGALAHRFTDGGCELIQPRRSGRRRIDAWSAWKPLRLSLADHDLSL